MNGLGKKSTWLQILFWGAVWVLIPLALIGFENINRTLLRSLQIFLAVFLVVFINLEILLPRLYFRKKVWLYILSCFGIILLAFVLFYWEMMPWSDFFGSSPESGRRGYKRPHQSARVFFKYIRIVSPIIISLIGSSLFAIASFASTKEKEMAQLKSEKLKAEMDFLKHQTNPHFLFNALNNIYTLSILKSENTSENLLKLSGMLRYMLYDCKEDRVALKKEIEYIENFVELNKLKDSQGLNIEVQLDRSLPNLMVAPLIFVPFIENAFKHSKIEDLENGWIKINLSVDKTTKNTLLFNVQNSIPENAFTKDSVGGIGLTNVRRQLELLYPEKHELTIEQTDKIFDVHLKIDL